jgi:hypothetical protein
MLIACFYWPYVSAKNTFGLIRDRNEQLLYSASWKSFRAYYGIELPTLIRGQGKAMGESQIYIPVVVRLLVFGGIFTTLYRQIARSTAKPRNGILLLVTGLVIFVVLASFGPSQTPGRMAIWDVLNLVPGFSGIRVPARLGFQIYIGCGLLVAISLSSQKKFAKILAIIASAAVVVESKPSEHFAFPFNSEKYSTIAEIIQNRGISEPILYLPVDESGTDFFFLASHLRNSFVNGRSSMTPKLHENVIFPIIRTCPSLACTNILKDLGVPYIIVNKHAYQHRLDFTNDFSVQYEDDTYLLLHHRTIKNSNKHLVTQHQWFTTPRILIDQSRCNQAFRIEGSDDRSLSDLNLETRWTTLAPQSSPGSLTVTPARPLSGPVVVSLSNPNRSSDFARSLKVSLTEVNGAVANSEFTIDYFQDEKALNQYLTLDLGDRKISKIALDLIPQPNVTDWWSIAELQLCSLPASI